MLDDREWDYSKIAVFLNYIVLIFIYFILKYI